MKVELAKKAGFCFGVNRAVETVYKEADVKEGPVYTYGPIIHNEEVIADLERKGVCVLDSLEQVQELGKQTPATIVIRSHGVSQGEQKALEDSGMKVVDSTCPFVKKIHTIVQEHAEKGFLVIVVGSAAHPEVQGIVGWGDPDRTIVIANLEEAQQIDLSQENKVCIVAQTTFNLNKFEEIVEIIAKMRYDSKGMVGENMEFLVHNTICSATRERQEAAKALSERVDAMIVIGGLSSSNTKKLYEICSKNCLNTYFIQTKEDLIETDFSRFDYVGITAGASTPNKIIEEVQEYVRNEL